MTQPPPTPSADRAARLVRNLTIPDRDGSVLLTAHPGPHWTPGLAAAVWNLPLAEAQARLDRLVQLDVLTPSAGRRYTMAIGIRAALERTAETVLLPGCRRARSRVVAYYTEHAVAADLAVDPGRWRWHPPVAEQVRLSMQDRFTSHAQAQAWFRNERDNLLAVAELAHHTSHHQQVILMAEAVGNGGERQRSHGMRKIIELGLASAESVDDDGAQAAMHHAVASQHLRCGEHALALASANYALALWSSEEPRRVHPYHGRGLVHLYLLLSQAYDQANDLLMAARYADLAARASETLGHPRDRALARYRQALALCADEFLDEAVALLRSALPPLTEAGEEVWAARVHRKLCEALLDLDQREAAHEHGHAALELVSQEEAPSPGSGRLVRRSSPQPIDARWKGPQHVKRNPTSPTFELEAPMTPSEVARLFRVDIKTVSRWAIEGRLSSFRTLGGHRRFPAREVRALRDQSLTPVTG